MELDNNKGMVGMCVCMYKILDNNVVNVIYNQHSSSIRGRTHPGPAVAAREQLIRGKQRDTESLSRTCAVVGYPAVAH
jgi:hypothetical protein